MTESLKKQDPVDVANLIIGVAKRNKLTITNFQLQKILFFYKDIL